MLPQKKLTWRVTVLAHDEELDHKPTIEGENTGTLVEKRHSV
jgi:hypothetical protein